MPEPMSTARLEQIRAVYVYDHEVIGELLDEVDRLREEDPVVTAMREQAATLKRAVLQWAGYFAAGVVAWNTCRHLLGWPVWAALVSCLAVGAVIGWGHAEIEAWWEERHDA